MTKESSPTGDRLKIILGSGCYLGYSPIMPGTFGALPGLLIYFLLWKFMPAPMLRLGLIVCVSIIILLNYYLTSWAINYWKSEDPSEFILDEIIGFLCVPMFYGAHDFNRTALIGFILFRIFDMIKIPPANYVDKNIKGAFGIVFDDVISAAYAALALFIINFINF